MIADPPEPARTGSPGVTSERHVQHVFSDLSNISKIPTVMQSCSHKVIQSKM